MSNIVVTDHGSHPHAGAYYRMCTWEPIGPSARMALGGVFPVQNLTLESLLDRILSEIANENGTVLVACHGNPEGIILPLITRQNKNDIVGASRDALNLISRGRAASVIAPMLKMTEAKLNELRSKMTAVRAKSLDRLEIRGCRVGANTSTLSAIQHFFGAACVGAPEIYNAWGTLEPNTNNANYDFTQFDTGSGKYHANVGASGHVGFQFNRTSQTTFRTSNVRATSASDFRRWGIETFPIRLRTVTQTPQGPVTQFRDMRADQIDQDPYDDVVLPMFPFHMQLDSQDNMVMPLAASYRSSLVEFRPSTLDPSDPLFGL